MLTLGYVIREQIKALSIMRSARSSLWKGAVAGVQVGAGKLMPEALDDAGSCARFISFFHDRINNMR